MIELALSLIIPCYNEASTVARVVEEAMALELGAPFEVIVVDDGSVDGSYEVLRELTRRYPKLKLLRHEHNQGKGAAVRTGLGVARGEYAIVRDADLEYESRDIPRLFRYARERGLDVVFGSRNLAHNPASSTLFYWGGRLVTAVANMLYRQRLTDEPTGYKLVRTGLLRSLDLKCRGFEFCPEVTAKLARLGHAIPEVPIAYHPRRVAEGKKIRARDGWQAVGTLLRYRWWRPADHFNALDRLIRWLRVRRAVAEAGSGARVLDVGCGPTAYLHRYLACRGVPHTYVGLDRRPPVVYLPPGSFVACDLERGEAFPLPDGSFDRVYLLALIEHVCDPRPLLVEARRVLAPGGVLVLTTPAPVSRSILEAMARFRLVNPEEIAEHQRYYAPGEVRRLLADAGFAAHRVRCRRFEFGLNVVGCAARD